MSARSVAAQEMADGKFEWDTQMQGFVLSSFYYGYITTTLVGGVLAMKFGGKILLLIAVAWTSALTIVTPPLTEKGDAVAMIVVRVLEGIGQVGVQVAARQRLHCDFAALGCAHPSCSA